MQPYQDLPLDKIPGIGPVLLTALRSKGFCTGVDLLLKLPRAYEDRSHITPISAITGESIIIVQVEITKVFSRKTQKSRILIAEGKDQTGKIELLWFRTFPGLESKWRALVNRAPVLLKGIPKKSGPCWQLSHPEQITQDQPSEFGRIVPIYTESHPITSKQRRKWSLFLLGKFAETFVKDSQKLTLLKKRKLPSLSQAIRELHWPSQQLSESGMHYHHGLNAENPNYRRLIYDEFLEFFVQIQKEKAIRDRYSAPKLGAISRWKSEILPALPFQLTADQNAIMRVLEQELADCRPTERFIYGDVGSGKSILAYICAWAGFKSSIQVALMAPTELLAQQHFQKFSELFTEVLVSQGSVALLTGSTPAAIKKKILTDLATKPCVVIGTHALFSEGVAFSNLGLIIIDEHHRFGTFQRQTLTAKKGLFTPHELFFSATPIPQTLAHIIFEKTKFSELKSRPSFQKQIVSKLVLPDQRSKAFEFISRILAAGQQVYLVFPAIDHETDISDPGWMSAEVFYRTIWSTLPIAQYSAALLHGKMKAHEKSKLLDGFKRKQTQVLIATSIIEVGIDIPNATAIMIFSAERFGLAQLHQLRGRVGRGTLQSFCFLLTSADGKLESKQRLEKLVMHSDGFKLAEEDWLARGHGQFFGAEQSGDFDFQYGDPIRDFDVLKEAKEDANWLLQQQPECK